MEACQDTNKGVDGVALDFLYRITKLVHDKADDLWQQLSLLRIWDYLSSDVECSSFLELQLSVAHLSQHCCAELSDQFSDAMLMVRLDHFLL